MGQNISYQFRATDSTRALNEHFKGLSAVGVKKGMTIELTGGLNFKLKPGSLLTNDGVLVTETSDLTFAVRDIQNPAMTTRIDALVATYAYAEISPAPTCTYAIVEGVEAEFIPAVPGVSGSDKYVLGYIGVQAGETLSYDRVWYQANGAEYELGANSVSNGVFNMTGLTTAYDTNTKVLTVSVPAKPLVVNGINTTFPAISQVFTEASDLVSIVYDLGSGMANIALPDTAINRIASPVYIESDNVNFSEADIHGATFGVFLTKADFENNNVTVRTLLADAFEGSQMSGAPTKLHVPMGDVYGISYFSILGTSGISVRIKLPAIVPVFAQCPGRMEGIGSFFASNVASGGWASVNDKFVVDGRMLCLIGATMGQDTFIPCTRHHGRVGFENIAQSRGMARLYHFLGHTKYSVTCMDNEPQEKYNNSNLFDTIGTRTCFKHADYVSVYYSGVGDPTKTADFNVFVNK